MTRQLARFRATRWRLRVSAARSARGCGSDVAGQRCPQTVVCGSEVAGQRCPQPVVRGSEVSCQCCPQRCPQRVGRTCQPSEIFISDDLRVFPEKILWWARRTCSIFFIYPKASHTQRRLAARARTRRPSRQVKRIIKKEF
jgi:hypothetical protein